MPQLLYVLSMVILVVLTPTYASDAIETENDLRFRHLTALDGLSMNTVIKMVQDKHGFIWIATQDGLNRYDGYEFVIYKRQQNDFNSLHSNFIGALHIDKSGVLWVGTRAGLHRYNEKTDNFSHFPLKPNSNKQDSIFSINDAEVDNQIWVATLGGGIARFNKETLQYTRYQHDTNNPKGISDNSIYKLFRDSKNQLWLGTKSHGLSRYNPETDTFKHYSPKDYPNLKHGRVYDIIEDSDGQLWLGTRGGGLCSFIQEKEKFTCFQHNNRPDSLADNHVYSLAIDKQNRIWVGTMPGGLHLFNQTKKTFSHYRPNSNLKEALSSESVYSLLVDNTGLIWIGTFGSGINILTPQAKQFGYVPPEPARKGKLNNASVFELLKDKQGRTWVGTAFGGINVIKNGKVIRYFKYDKTKPNSLRSNFPISMYRDKNDDIWVGTENGFLHRYRPETDDFEIYTHTKGDPYSFIQTDRVKFMLEDARNNFWIGTHDGLVRFDRKNERSYIYQHIKDKENSLSSNVITSLAVDLSGNLWIGTRYGLNSYDYQSDEFIRHAVVNSETPLNDQHIYSLYIDKRAIWIGTSSGGINKYNPERNEIIYITENQGLSNNRVYSILPDDNNDLWLATNKGISQFTPETTSFNNYFKRHGLQDNEFNQSAAYKANDGSLLFGGINGYNDFQPNKIKYDNTKATPIVTSLYIFNEKQKIQTNKGSTALTQNLVAGGKINLVYEQSVFSLEFSALHFTFPEHNKFSFFLQGFDDEWIITNAKNRRATYTKVPPGSYLFRLKASNGDNVWSNEEYQLSVNILPPWWLTWWAKTLATSLIISLLFITYWWRIRYFKQQQLLLEKLVIERTETINQQKQALEESYENISRLSEIGLKVNSTLDVENILHSLFDNIKSIMDASNFGIGIYNEEKQEIQYDFVIFEGERYLPYARTMKEPEQFPVWCIKNKQAILIKDAVKEAPRYFGNSYRGDIKEHFNIAPQNYEPITKNLSMIYVPLLINQRVLGVFSVQSEQKNAFETVHLNMMTTLATYTANALENANMYARLQQAQEQLIESEKMTSIANLVMGVSHEMNTPLGIGVTAASHLQYELLKLVNLNEEKKLSQGQFNLFLSESKNGFTLLGNALTRCSDLMQSLKNIVVMHTVGNIDDVDISLLINESVRLHKNSLDKRKIIIELDMLTSAPARTYQNSISKIINALIENSFEHAFPEPLNSQAIIAIKLNKQGEQYLLEYTDNGCGLSSQQQDEIFEPFTTSKRAQGSVGLGMYAVYSQVKQRLQGTIEISSKQDKGVKITIEIPRKITNKSDGDTD